MRPSMSANGMALPCDFANDFWVAERHLADREECRLRAVLRQRVENGLSMEFLWAIVERQYNLLHRQEVVDLVVLEAEPRTTCCVDFDRASDRQSIRVGGADFSMDVRCQRHRQHRRKQKHTGEQLTHRATPISGLRKVKR